MNRNQRKYGIPSRLSRRQEHDIEIKIPKAPKLKISVSKGVLNPKRAYTFNRCCYVSPEQKEFGHTTDSQDSDLEKSTRPNTTSQSDDTNRQMLRWQRHVTTRSVEKLQNSSQCKSQREVRIKPKVMPAYVETSDGCQWQNLENINDIDRYIDRETLTFHESQPTTFHISNIPRVKLIAEKFTKYKQNNLQVRKLDEKVVCVEYDVYDCVDDLNPVQVMRTFFSVKPDSVENGQDTKSTLTKLPSNIKKQFEISPEDLTQHSEKEVEIIDDKLIENHKYLEDLRKILLRKQDYASKRNAATLDLQSLYEIARKDCLHFDRAGAEVLLTKELQEIKDLILKNCKSCVHGIKRHTVRRNEIDIPGEKETNNGVISRSLFAELVKNESCTKK